MSTRGIGDAYAFQRLLWLLIGTVIVPTVLLSLYGGMAIRNQQAAIYQQLTSERETRLQVAAQALFAELEEVDERVRRAVAACDAPQCEVEAKGVTEVWTWDPTDPAPVELQAIGLPRQIDERTTWFVPHDGTAPVGAFASGPVLAAFRVDREALDQLLRRTGRDVFGRDARLSLEGSAPGPATSFDDMLERWQLPRTELLLDRPLGQWRLVLSYPQGDPADEILGRTAWLYPIGLASLVLLVVIGTVVTLVSASREIRLSRLQTDFVSSVSHELRTPLTSIRMFVETLQSGRLQDRDKVDECLDLLARETDRLSRMIERVLNWARMEAGRRVYELEDVPVRELVDDALRALRTQHLLDDDDEAIQVELDPALPPLRADRDAIVEALLNLLQNAVKYTPPPRRIVVSATWRGSRIGLTVSDNGPGVQKRDRKRIFEKFYQADTRLSASTFSAAGRGSGLGLSIVRAVVRGHGGKVDLETELGVGSRFTMWLPASRGELGSG